MLEFNLIQQKDTFKRKTLNSRTAMFIIIILFPIIFAFSCIFMAKKKNKIYAFDNTMKFSTQMMTFCVHFYYLPSTKARSDFKSLCHQGNPNLRCFPAVLTKTL